MDLDFKSEVSLAYKRIHSFLYKTPLNKDFYLSNELHAEIYMKMENWQRSGSFKIRGVLNKILRIPEVERSQQHFVAASTGNHAAAFAYVMHLFGLSGEVFVPEQVNATKKALVESMGMQCRLIGNTSLETELFARDFAEKNGHTLVHPYNDVDVVLGQGTIGYEILHSLPETDCIVVPVGGGGMIAGIASYAKSINKNIKIIGVQPVNSPEMFESLKKGYIIEDEISKPTLSDGTAGGIEQNAITFKLCQQYVDEIVLISESEIAAHLKETIKRHQFIIEGAAAMSIALTRKRPDLFIGKNAVLVLCGRRLSFDKLKEIIK